MAEPGAGVSRTHFVREDVHLHVPLDEVRARLRDVAAHERWLSRHFSDFTSDGRSCAFRLRLPFRTEQARLRLTADEPSGLVFARAGEGSIESLTWALHPEGRNESHVTAEIAYRPAGGIAGALLERLLHRPHRGQALRDSLWNLKRLFEADRPSNGASAL